MAKHPNTPPKPQAIFKVSTGHALSEDGEIMNDMQIEFQKSPGKTIAEYPFITSSDEYGMTFKITLNDDECFAKQLGGDSSTRIFTYFNWGSVSRLFEKHPVH